VGGDADAQSSATELLDLREISGHGVLPKARKPAAGVGGMEHDELDTYRRGRIYSGI
jgi:hypothetical protein